ncbi:hypothetical protein L7F22_023619 [Adiantum nelumboides]|nr:hypothetical protein [Adiantum nelumboides]
MTMVKAMSTPALLPKLAPLAFSNRSFSLSSSPFASRPIYPRFASPLTSANRRTPISLRAMSATSTATSPIAVGDKLPDATFAYLDKEGQVQTVSVADLTKGKKAVLFAVPGAFTPTCSQKHLPGFVEKADELRAKGIDSIACISVNDVFVMRAWGESVGVGDKVLLLSDGNLTFTRAIGATLDLSDKPVGLGVRSRRYSLLADDGVVRVLHLEEGGSFTSSGADDIFKAL